MKVKVGNSKKKSKQSHLAPAASQLAHALLLSKLVECKLLSTIVHHEPSHINWRENIEIYTCKESPDTQIVLHCI